MDHLHLCTSMHLFTLLFHYYCCCTVCTALLFSYSAIFIAASVRNKLIHSTSSCQRPVRRPLGRSSRRSCRAFTRGLFAGLLGRWWWRGPTGSARGWALRSTSVPRGSRALTSTSRGRWRPATTTTNIAADRVGVSWFVCTQLPPKRHKIKSYRCTKPILTQNGTSRSFKVTHFRSTWITHEHVRTPRTCDKGCIPTAA